MESNPQTSQEVSLYVFGSCETDQFMVFKKDEEGNEIVDDDRFYSKAAIDFTRFIRPYSAIIHKIACGGIHTVLLTTTGKLLTFGCNDDGALGREGDEKTPLPVELDHPVDMISAGDSHTTACNSANSIVYYWGIYRTTSGNMSTDAKRVPEKIGEGEFKKKQITKILSGAHHTLVLADGRVYAWGDPETYVLGRMPLARRKNDQAQRIEALGLRNVDDIYTGAYHSFCKVHTKKRGQTDKISEIYAWGLNNHGQLGIGNTKNTYTPTLIEAFSGKDVKKIVGGEHHTIALMENGEVYAFGRDDDGQVGLGEDFKEDREMEEEAPKKSANKKKGKNDEPEMSEEHKLAMEKISEKFKYVMNPQKVAIEDVKEIYACGSFNYATTKDSEHYSWGNGDQYVLGNRKEDSEYEPYKINPKQLNEMKVLEFGLGSQHVVFTASSDPNAEKPQLENSVFEKIVELKSAKKTPGKKGGKTTAKKSDKDEDEEVSADEAKESKDKSKVKAGKNEKEEDNGKVDANVDKAEAEDDDKMVDEDAEAAKKTAKTSTKRGGRSTSKASTKKNKNTEKEDHEVESDKEEAKESSKAEEPAKRKSASPSKKRSASPAAKRSASPTKKRGAAPKVNTETNEKTSQKGESQSPTKKRGAAPKVNTETNEKTSQKGESQSPTKRRGQTPKVDTEATEKTSQRGESTSPTKTRKKAASKDASEEPAQPEDKRTSNGKKRGPPSDSKELEKDMANGADTVKKTKLNGDKKGNGAKK